MFEFKIFFHIIKGAGLGPSAGDDPGVYLTEKYSSVLLRELILDHQLELGHISQGQNLEKAFSFTAGILQY